MNILLVGYYNRGNLGDDLMMYVLNKIIPGKITNVCVDDCGSSINNRTSDCDTVILGGGDVINPYFLEKLTNINKPIYALSVGVPYHSYLDSGFASIIDYAMVRNYPDYVALKAKLGFRYVCETHDISFLLPEYVTNSAIDWNTLQFLNNNKCNSVVGLCLSRTIMNDGGYDRVVIKFAKLVTDMICDHNLVIVMISFGSNMSSFEECDYYLYKDILEKVTPYVKRRVHVVDPALCNMFNVYNIFKRLTVNVCSRFHAHVMSIMTKTPFISFCHTPKVTKLLGEYNLNAYGVSDITKISGLVYELLFYHPNTEFRNMLSDLYEETIKPDLKNSVTFIRELVAQGRRRLSPPRFLAESDRGHIVFKIIKDVLKISGVDNEGDLMKVANRDTVTRLIIFRITGDVNSAYYSGLYEKVYDNLYGNIEWIVKDYYGNHKTLMITPKGVAPVFNFDFIYQHDSNGVHRCGWEYVLNNLIKNFNNSDGIYFDAYVDRTFLWGSEVLEYCGVIPYDKYWCGVIHHTPDCDYTDNNIVRLINSPCFKKSLEKCVGLYVLSSWLKEWLSERLKGVVVEVLYHPTEFVENTFTMKKYDNNPEKKIVQIGAWLRNIYSIYALKSEIQKCALVGKMMDSYYPPNNDHGVMHERPSGCVVAMSREKCQNKYFYFMDKYLRSGGRYDDIDSNYKSVTLLKNLNNDDYDFLLSRNIVFLDLIEASGCNTLIECIVRNTPILINRIPAVVEYLGPDYPFYYDTLEEAGNKLANLEMIKNAHLYLTKMSKAKLQVEYFIASIKRGRIYAECIRILREDDD